MKYLILSAVCLGHLFLLPSGFAQNPTPVAERRTIILDVFVVDLKNQLAEDIETLSKEKAKFNKAVADGKIKIVANNRIRCLSGETNNLRLSQRIPIQSGSNPQVPYENVGFSLSITTHSAADKMIEVKYAIEWSASIANYLDAYPAFIQRTLSGLTKLSPNELTPIIDSIQREPLWKPATPANQEKPNESTGNFLVLFSGRVVD
jgi:hypothetical protein